MRTHPVFLCLAGRRCVVVGEGALAEDKAERCLEAGADVVVVAPDPTPGLRALAAAGRLAWIERAYRTGDLDGAILAYAAVRDAALIQTLRRDADAARVLLNVIDVPEACDFFAPAVVTRGALRIAIGTGGLSPTLAARVRGELETRYGAEYAPYVALLGAVRGYLGPAGDRAVVMARLVDSDLLQHVRDGDVGAIDRVLRDVVGGDCSVGRLGVALEGGW